MRYILLLIFLSLTLFACKKEQPNNVTPFDSLLAGKWRMVSVKDNLTNNITTKPLVIIGNVDITFTFSTSLSGLMTGVTPTNSLSGDFLLGRNRTISIPAVSATEVAETNWGLLFLDNIILAREFIFDQDGKLNILTLSDKTLTFIRK